MDTIESQIDQEMSQANNPPQAGQDPVAQSIDQEMNQQKYGTPSQQVLAGVEGGLKGALGPIATGVETFLGNSGVDSLSPEAQVGREEVNPWTHGIAETAGLVGSALTGFGQAKVLSEVGEAAGPVARALGIGGPGAGIFDKIGSAAVRGAVENGLYQAGDEISKTIQGRPSDMIQTALPNIGLASLIGGTLGAGAGGVSALWKSTAGTKAGALLNAISDRAGGIEGVESNPVNEMVAKTGMDISPEVQAGLSDDPAVKEMFNTLNQSDTTNSGREFQNSLKEFHQKAGDTMAESLGKSVEEVPDQFDKYNAGKSIGDVLADEVAEKVDPLSEKYNEIAEKFKDATLEPSIADRSSQAAKDIAAAEKEVDQLTQQVTTNEYGTHPKRSLEVSEKLLQAEGKLKQLKRDAITPGTTDMLTEKISQLANEQGWTASPSSNIMSEVNRVLKELPEQRTLKNLSDYIKAVGDNTFDPLDGSLTRAGGMMKKILRETESEVMGAHVGAKEGEAALNEYRSLQKDWSSVSDLREQLDERLHAKAKTSSYAKAVRELAQTDGEGIFRKLSGKNDANVLNLLSESFPKTAEALKNAHLDQILSYAKDGDHINPNRVINALNNKTFSPQLKSFVTGEAGQRIDALGEVIEKLKDRNYNFSNTGRTVDKLLGNIPGSAVGIATMLMGHNPALAFVLGGLTKYVSKDAPDAVRLGLLKWLGSNKPIDPGAFKSMVDLIHHTIQGQTVMSQASRALISGGSKVLPAHLMPSDGKIKELDTKLKKTMNNPSSFEGSGDSVAHYMPNHGIAATATIGQAAQIMNSLRPQSVKNAPLDQEMKPTDFKQQQFQRQLSLAEQPLLVLHLCKEGQLTNQDVQLCRSMYPDFMNKLSSQLTQDMVHHLSQGKEIDPNIQIGLSKLMGQPMTSSLQHERVASNQAIYAQAAQDSAAMGGQSTPKKASSSLVGLRNMKVASRVGLGSKDDDS